MSVVPTEKDFLFIKPGALWHKVRQQTAWTSERLRNLSDGYSWFQDDAYKRNYVKKNVIDVVKKNEGRFLRPGATAGVWDIMEDESRIMIEIMRILRQIKNSYERKEDALRKVHASIDKHLSMIERRVEEMSSVLKALQKRGTKRTSTGGPWTKKQAIKVFKGLDSMLKTAKSCGETMGIVSDELTDDQFSEDDHEQEDVDATTITVWRASDIDDVSNSGNNDDKYYNNDKGDKKKTSKKKKRT